MSLDDIVRDAGSSVRPDAPVLCLPHQCEFLSDRWLDRAREFLQRAIAKRSDIAPFSLQERFDDAPPHLGFANNIAHWSLQWNGTDLTVGRESLEAPDLNITGTYQMALAGAQTVGALVPERMKSVRRETKHWFGAATAMSGRLPQGAMELLGLFHDHMARITVENPDIAHRARALGLTRHLGEIEAQGYTVIEGAISPAFADEVRAATLQALLPHNGDQLQWMLYHGSAFEGLVQNPQLMTLIDATLGRGAVIASISSIRKGPGPGTIPMHTDYSMIPEPYPEFAMTGVGVWALEDWTRASGPTWIVPGSHRERRAPRKGEGLDRGVPIEMPKGSVVYFTHGVWHWQGDREETGDRVTIHSHFNRGILRGLEPKRVDAQMIHRNPPRLGEMLLDANGRDYLRAGHMARLQKFTDEQLRELRA